MAGMLVLVVGPSGAGKDTLIASAAERLIDDRRFIFPRRMITRKPDGATENHIAITRQEFDERVADNDFTLAWRAHGLGYVLPKDVARYVATGKIAVCNGSRHVVAEALRKYPTCTIVVVDASRAVRARRLASRGRESLDEINARLEREGADIPDGAPMVRIDNSGHLAESVDAFCQALLLVARQAEGQGQTA
jgi:ribose 1,5-bisphosphokinase